MESAPDGINGWLLGALGVLLGIIWTGLRDKIKTHDKRLNNHGQRLQDLDGQKEKE